MPPAVATLGDVADGVSWLVPEPEVDGATVDPSGALMDTFGISDFAPTGVDVVEGVADPSFDVPVAAVGLVLRAPGGT